jgi:hypothetical protein
LLVHKPFVGIALPSARPTSPPAVPYSVARNTLALPDGRPEGSRQRTAMSLHGLSSTLKHGAVRSGGGDEPEEAVSAELVDP